MFHLDYSNTTRPLQKKVIIWYS